MVNTDTESDKKSISSRGRIMQVVEVEEDDVSKESIDIPVPSEIMKNTHTSDVSDEDTSREQMKEHNKEGTEEIENDERVHDMKHETSPDFNSEVLKEIHPLHTDEKKDIVSELFETKKDSLQYPNISIDRKPSRFGFIVWVFILLAIVGAIGGGLLFFKQKSVSQNISPVIVLSPTTTPIPTETDMPIASPSGISKNSPSVTPTKIASLSATPKKTGLSVQVLNGSGKSGAATTMKKFLEEKGYNVVGTGNAKNFSYEKTEIAIKSDKISLMDKLKSDLSEKYSMSDTSGTLDSSVSYDAQVIIGAE